MWVKATVEINLLYCDICITYSTLRFLRISNLLNAVINLIFRVLLLSFYLKLHFSLLFRKFSYNKHRDVLGARVIYLNISLDKQGSSGVQASDISFYVFFSPITCQIIWTFSRHVSFITSNSEICIWPLVYSV